MTDEESGRTEPGWKRFEAYYRRTGASDASLKDYAKAVGAVRRLAPKALLELSPDEVEALDEHLIERASMYRTVLRMYFRANKRGDMAELIPRRKHKSRRMGLDDILMPADIAALIRVSGNNRDAAILAVLGATGSRISETLSLRVRDLKQSNGAYQVWFAKPKVKGEERYSPKIEGAWKQVLDAWLKVTPNREPDDWLFPNADNAKRHPVRRTIARHFGVLAKMAGISKPVNPHAFRHARVTWGIINKEDRATLSTQIWGVPASPMLNRYSHFSGLDTTVDAPKEIVLPPMPAMPTVPDFDGKRLEAISARIAALEASKPVRTIKDLDERVALEEQRVRMETARMSKGEMEARAKADEMAEQLQDQQMKIEALETALAKLLKTEKRTKKGAK